MAKKRSYKGPYKRIDGNLTIYYDGRIFCGDIEMKYPDEKVTLEVGKLKRIIKDVVKDTKDGYWK